MNTSENILKSFKVGGPQWLLSNENHVIKTIDEVIRSRNSNSCTIVDVGMNFGFFSMIGLVHGCKVYAFEIQENCIAYAYAAAKANNVEQVLYFPNITDLS